MVWLENPSCQMQRIFSRSSCLLEGKNFLFYSTHTMAFLRNETSLVDRSSYLCASMLMGIRLCLRKRQQPMFHYIRYLTNSISIHLYHMKSLSLIKSKFFLIASSNRIEGLATVLNNQMRPRKISEARYAFSWSRQPLEQHCINCMLYCSQESILYVYCYKHYHNF